MHQFNSAHIILVWGMSLQQDFHFSTETYTDLDSVSDLSTSCLLFLSTAPWCLLRKHDIWFSAFVEQDQLLEKN